MGSVRIPADADMGAEIDVTGLGDEPGGVGDVSGIARAIENARKYGTVTYLTIDGWRVAAIVGTEGIRAG